jgi:putative nucleotidyltransferase with HDIG domain
MLADEDTRSSVLNFRLSELVEDSEHSNSRDSAPHVALPRHFLAFLPLSVFATLAVVVGPILAVAALVPRHGVLWGLLAVVLAVACSLMIASAGAWLWMRWPRSREVIFAELMLWGWVRRFLAERRLARTRDLFESARESGSTVSIELLTQLCDLHQAVDPYLHGHSRRVASYAVRIAREMRLSPEEIASVETAALVHDIGKIYTPQEILHKPDRLTDREFAIVKLHARDGAEILADAGDPRLTAIVRHHHERFDGSGYPDGIQATEIPLGSRIIAVADTFDAITSSRPYRPPRSHKEAIDVLSSESGTQFDAVVVTAFLACYAARRPVVRSVFASTVCERVILAIKTSSTSLTAGSVAQALPALGVAGVLATTPASHHDGVNRRYEATPTAAHLVSGRAPTRATVPQARHLSAGGPFAGRRETPRARITFPHTSSTSPKVQAGLGTSVSEPGPSPASREPTQNPVGPKSEPSNPTAPVPISPTSPPVESPPVGVPPPQPTLPVHPVEPPVALPPTPPVTTPPVTIPVPNTPVQITVPSLTVPAANIPATDVSSLMQSVDSQVGR